jgi:hypothetical protein
MTNDLDGWMQIQDLPSMDDLNRFLAKRTEIDRTILIKAAKKVAGFRVPSHFKADFGMVNGLTFITRSGSNLLIFPSEWPSDTSLRKVRLYTMGNTTAEHFSSVVRRFHEALENLLLPTEAHAGDGG